MGYRIKTVAAMIGVPRNTLLAWERRYDIVRPVRQANGYREYSESDVARLKEIKTLLDQGYRISEAISLSKPGDPGEQDSGGLLEELLASLLKLDRVQADHILRRGAGMSYIRRLNELFFPLLRRVGDLWEAGSVSVAQEHFISHFCRDHLTAMLLSLEHGPGSGPTVLCASWPDDQHDLALLGVAVKRAMAGSRIIFLGARTPEAALLKMAEEHQPDQVCISVTLPAEPAALVRTARSLSALGCAVIFGGQGLPVGLPAVERVEWRSNSSDP